MDIGLFNLGHDASSWNVLPNQNVKSAESVTLMTITTVAYQDTFSFVIIQVMMYTSIAKSAVTCLR